MDLIARLKAFKETSTSRLVFPTSQGNPMGNSLLVSCKRIAKRAGLNCGVCKTCIKSGQCQHWYLHKFRATFATRCLQDGMTVADVQEQLGHNDLESTTHYLGNLKKPDMRARVDAGMSGSASQPGKGFARSRLKEPEKLFRSH